MEAFFIKILAFFMTIIMFLFPTLNIPETEATVDDWNTEYTFVFVHGLGGWGEYDFANKVMPYWGVATGDMMKYLRARGFDVAAASVTPAGSAWDRACELYAQLTGTRVDYGKAHSEKYGHSQYGTDYTGKALIDEFDAENKINLLGHSFGGATILMFLDLMADGSEAEREVTPIEEISPLFTGGKADWIYSMVTLSAPMNGTSAYEVRDAVMADPNATLAEKAECEMISIATTMLPNDGRSKDDSAEYDMKIDHAQAMLANFETQENVYYFSVPTDATMIDEETGKVVPNYDLVEPLFQPCMHRVCDVNFVTEGGIVVDESWWPNDGLVNTISAKAPFNAPSKDYDENDVQSGIWNIMPTFIGDHTVFMGDLTKMTCVREFYVDILNMINEL